MREEIFWPESITAIPFNNVEDILTKGEQLDLRPSRQDLDMSIKKANPIIACSGQGTVWIQSLLTCSTPRCSGGLLSNPAGACRGTTV